MVGDPFILTFAALFGLCVGSFLNVCIYRLPNEKPEERSLFRPPSTCPNCKQRIVWRDNLPVVSWIMLRGKCRWCRTPISLQYPLIELAVAFLWFASFLAYGFSSHAFGAAVFGTLLLGIAIIDGRHYVIPTELNLGGLVVGVGLSLMQGFRGFVVAVLGAAAGAAVLWVVRVVGGRVFKEEAMGWGDIYMMAMVGAFVGWQGVLLTIFLGALVGSLVYLPLLILKKKRVVPFGVFLAIGAAATFVFGSDMIGWYTHFLLGS